MRRFSLFLVILLTLVLGRSAFAATTANKEWIIVVGGPSLYQWEHYKVYPHDHWWANFVRAARIRTEQLRGELGADAKITWLVYKQGYLDRAQQEHQDLVGFIDSVRDKYSLNLVYFHGGAEVINYYELTKIDRRDFARGAYVRSWGCHTGESMSKKWYRATGTHMIGAIGKTQFMMEELPILISDGGKWVN